MKIAIRINDVEEKSTKCIKEARTQLKKVQRPNADQLPCNDLSGLLHLDANDG